MENIQKPEKNTLFITAYCFNILLDFVINQFNTKYNDLSLNKVTQLYGFGNYDNNKPNLREELEKLAGGFINGKYLYDKSRELQSGKPVLKLNGYYKVVLFRYIGYDNIRAFIEKEIHDINEKKKQLQLLSKITTDHTYYYISHHFGENKEIIKGQVTVFNARKNIQYKYLYPQKDGSIKEFLYHGTAVRRDDTLHIKTKTLIGGKMVEGGDEVLYIGHSEPWSSSFLIGTYSAYDIYNKTIAGKLIFEKVSSKDEMIKKSLDPKIPAYIVQEIRNKRIVNRGVVPDDYMEISPNSPYSITYEKIPGKYNLLLSQQGKELGNLKFTIDEHSFKVYPQDEGIWIEKDNIEIINKGSVIHFSFQFTGIALFSQLEIFFKTYYLNKGEKDIQGVFSGIDIENRLISGELNVVFEPLK